MDSTGFAVFWQDSASIPRFLDLKSLVGKSKRALLNTESTLSFLERLGWFLGRKLFSNRKNRGKQLIKVDFRGFWFWTIFFRSMHQRYGLEADYIEDLPRSSENIWVISSTRKMRFIQSLLTIDPKIPAEISSWNLKHLFISGCLNWVIPFLYIIRNWLLHQPSLNLLFRVPDWYKV